MLLRFRSVLIYDAVVVRSWKKKARELRELKTEVTALYFVLGDSRVSKLTKLVAFCVVAYALSPIDLIPDFIPVLGYLDDLILIPLGVAFVIRSIPHEVLAECRAKAHRVESRIGLIGASIMVLVWILAAFLVFAYLKPYIFKWW